MDINQKFFDDVIITLMEMNDRLVALEEMAAEHVAEHETASDDFSKVPEWDLPENAKSIQEKIINAFEDGFAAGEKRAISVAENKGLCSSPAPEVKEKRKTFFDGMAFVLENMKDRDDAGRILNHFAEMNSGEIA
ncbi:hypothetical protein ET317_21605 [Salmonella enterica]|nr:hypothetical protein [Salmonella enterica]